MPRPKRKNRDFLGSCRGHESDPSGCLERWPFSPFALFAMFFPACFATSRTGQPRGPIALKVATAPEFSRYRIQCRCLPPTAGEVFRSPPAVPLRSIVSSSPFSSRLRFAHLWARGKATEPSPPASSSAGFNTQLLYDEIRPLSNKIVRKFRQRGRQHSTNSVGKKIFYRPG